MAASADFFGQRSPQAILKHGVLTRYAYYFAGRAGAATQGRVVFIDGYAGAGRYEDGSPGSPLLLASQAERAKVFGRDVKLLLIEQDEARRAKLRKSLSDSGVEYEPVLDGDLESHIDALLDRFADHAVLLFVDPFGLAINRSTLERILSRRSRRQPVDVLYHFSLSTVARMGRAGVVAGITSAPNAAQLDAALGAIPWRDPFERATMPNAPTQAALNVAQRFGASVGSQLRMPVTGVEVRDRPGHLPKYVLMLFSGDAKAHWDFADLAGKAHVEWLLHCDTADYEANVQHLEASGLQQLFAEPEPNEGEIDRQIRREALEYLPGHLAQLIQHRGSLRAVDAVADTYGDVLGRARATHIREALKQLHAGGSITDDGRGDFWNRQVC